MNNNDDQGNAAAGGAHQNAGAAVAGGGGGHQFGPVLGGLLSVIDALAILSAASARIRGAVNRIRQVTEVTTLVPALRDVMSRIEESVNLMQLNSLNMFMEVYAEPHRVMYPWQIRTTELGARMVSTAVMWLHSLVQFNSNLRVDGHGPRFRIHRELAQLHLALSDMQRSLDLLFSLEPPGFVFEEDDMQE